MHDDLQLLCSLKDDGGRQWRACTTWILFGGDILNGTACVSSKGRLLESLLGLPFLQARNDHPYQKYSRNPNHIYNTRPVPFTAKTVVTSCRLCTRTAAPTSAFFKCLCVESTHHPVDGRNPRLFRWPAVLATCPQSLFPPLHRYPT